ncbi:cytochrome P450 3A14-like [Tropilaelaps mercedesae]|uniref:Cytochrome P450 3A14-like n=1 Tax=Tropilaelaps mercedesae TaxID=418985 RepID=A0A1V9X9R6_9ACAR|nr:cytochrome P450 3A14-like [Tropilaelaps mercedesae]
MGSGGNRMRVALTGQGKVLFRRNPSRLQALYEELARKDMMERVKDIDNVAFEEYGRIKLVKACVLETLRLLPTEHLLPSELAPKPSGKLFLETIQGAPFLALPKRPYRFSSSSAEGGDRRKPTTFPSQLAMAIVKIEANKELIRLGGLLL